MVQSPITPLSALLHAILAGTAKDLKGMGAAVVTNGGNDAGPPVLQDDDRESIDYLDRAVAYAMDPKSSLESILRACSHAATLKNNQSAADYFARHITGFPEDVGVPRSRMIMGQIAWVGERDWAPFHEFDPAGAEANRVLSRPHTVLRVTANLAWIRAMSTRGYFQPASDVEAQNLVVRGISDPWRTVYPVEHYDSLAFEHCLEMIRQEAFTWASQNIAFMKYGSRITDIWQRHRSTVDSAVQEIGLANHFASIDRLLGSTNEQDWRGAMYACRSLLQDLADYLWKDERKTYPPLSRRDSKGNLIPLEVTQDKYVNRLMAYMNEKSSDKGQTKLTSTQLSYLGDILYMIYQTANNAHAKVSRDLAETTAIHTYMLISDMIRLTDMEPVVAASKY